MCSLSASARVFTVDLNDDAKPFGFRHRQHASRCGRQRGKSSTTVVPFSEPAGVATKTTVAGYVLQGLSYKEIAQALSIIPLTVQQHLKGVFEKVKRARHFYVGF
jgi:ATP/maltotriose-dependent transcriptional regulator MalT